MPKIRKIIKTGHSLAITIPALTIKEFDLKEGDLAQVSLNWSRSSITYTFSGHPRQLSLIDKSRPKV
ncbi:hypothetical protein A3K55_00610 [Candidatus Shapirobacteria bacterium RBG_13_44_7]|uniref:SpoVT-AbrB domain-containing protein n=1 Tax=Candidatus Shapirobacteria bacterium RBG_13_44_7 TaxID=1802149 RepID=A0A1F7SEV4_9BACT|nr:MAG: hypothetical protein A3K55_00610 [Candidatus Shapirobacteria bacterium RBG_13_44_7]